MFDKTETPVQTDEAADALKLEVPPELVDFRENISSRPVYIYIKTDINNLPSIAREGLKSDETKFKERDSKVEAIFDSVAKEHDIKIDRSKCVFAYPRTPSTLRSSLSFREGSDVMLQAQVDPSKSIVADGSLFTLASDITPNGSSRSDEEIIDLAEEYWGSAKTLSEYLSEGHFNDNDDDDFEFPEVLTTDIPSTLIRVTDKR